MRRSFLCLGIIARGDGTFCPIGLPGNTSLADIARRIRAVLLLSQPPALLSWWLEA